MKALARLDARGVRAVLVDIDETLTTAGKLTGAAYAALERLHAAGRIVVPVTGRPAGWCDHIARMWPVDAVVGENGAFYFHFSEGRLHKRFPLGLDAAERIAALMRDAGLNAKISSIHVNGWFGGYDKLATSRVLFSERFGLDLDVANKEFVFAGDSANDAPMFGFFENSVGVANVRRFEGRLAAAPKYVTREASGAGFIELVEHLLQG